MGPPIGTAPAANGATGGHMTDYGEYDGPPAWWERAQLSRLARRPLCDECGTPNDDDSDEDGGGEE